MILAGSAVSGEFALGDLHLVADSQGRKPGLEVAEMDFAVFPRLRQPCMTEWGSRPERYRDPEAPLARSPMEVSIAAFRHTNGLHFRPKCYRNWQPLWLSTMAVVVA